MNVLSEKKILAHSIVKSSSSSGNRNIEISLQEQFYKKNDNKTCLYFFIGIELPLAANLYCNIFEAPRNKRIWMLQLRKYSITDLIKNFYRLNLKFLHDFS